MICMDVWPIKLYDPYFAEQPRLSNLALPVKHMSLPLTSSFTVLVIFRRFVYHWNKNISLNFIKLSVIYELQVQKFGPVGYVTMFLLSIISQNCITVCQQLFSPELFGVSSKLSNAFPSTLPQVELLCYIHGFVSHMF